MIDFIVQYWLDILFGVLVSILSILYANKRKKLNETKKENYAVKTATILLLRESLINFYWEYKAKGFCPIEDRETILSLLKEYNLLGGNSNISELVDEILTLPKAPDNSILLT